MNVPRTQPPIVLDAAAVEAAMPSLDEQLALAERAMRALADGTARLPPKVGLTARPTDSFAHAMPAWMAGPDPSGAEDLLGLKWVTGFPDNRAVGLPAIAATVLLGDPRTGLTRAVLDGGPITARRTAAVSGVGLRLFGPLAGRKVSVGILGAGVQARSHIPVVGHLLPGARLRIFDRHRARAEAVANEARRTAGIGEVEAVASARDAVDGAEVVLTLVSFGPPEARQTLEAEWLAPDVTVVAVDYDMSIPAAVAAEADVFATDERAQFLTIRAEGWLTGYPDPPLTLGEALLAGPVGMSRPAGRRALVMPLGVGLADLVFAEAVLRRSEGGPSTSTARARRRRSGSGDAAGSGSKRLGAGSGSKRLGAG